MFATLVHHAYLKFMRSASFSRNMATLIFLGFLCLLFGSYFLAAAFLLDSLLQQFFNTENTFPYLCQLLIYYFTTEVLMRYFLQSLPVLDLQQYIHLPVGRKSLMHFILLRSYVHPFNFLSAIFFLPYTLHVLVPQLGGSSAWAWWGSMVLLSLLIHNGMFIFKKHLDDKPLGTGLLIGLVALSAFSQYMDWFSLGKMTAPFFEMAARLSWLPVVLAAGLVFAYVLNLFFLLRHSYPEDWGRQGAEKIQQVPALGLLQRLGLAGELIGLEIRLILRHKRSRSILMLSSFFLFYGLIFYTNPDYLNDMQAFLIFVGIFITGIFMMNYGQLLFSWNSGHFDFFLTKPITAYDYVKAKYYLMVGVGLLTFVLAIPYVYFGWKVLYINTMMLLFNLGVNMFVVMNLSMWAPKKINLSKGSMMNYEGLGAAQWLMAIPIIGLPYAVYIPFAIFDNPTLGITALGGMGLIGLLFHRRLLALSTRRVESKKYQISHSFRNEN
ncbi:DUF5687 family protein [Nafulsella turpanensis]|uniref:DUF5687 family protein n=1 Tax=Nafulsella turpanensis TaxID=1265690 RepID=UPI0003480EB1|nr:DUF5687 family protein [Nafulsella turpanensis]